MPTWYSYSEFKSVEVTIVKNVSSLKFSSKDHSVTVRSAILRSIRLMHLCYPISPNDALYLETVMNFCLCSVVAEESSPGLLESSDRSKMNFSI